MEENASLKKELGSLKDKLASSNAKKLAENFVEVNGVHLFYQYVEGSDRNSLMKLGDNLKGLHDDFIILLAGGNNGDHPLVCFAGGKGAKIGAGAVLKEVGPILNARGGGKPEMASGSAKDVSKGEEAFAKMKSLVK
jgi:alanyl-tRNA synthetase